MCTFILFVNTDTVRWPCIVLPSHLWVFWHLATHSQCAQAKILRFFKDSFHAPNTCTLSSISLTDSPHLHCEGPSQSLFSVQKASLLLCQTGKKLLKYFWCYLQPLLRSPPLPWSIYETWQCFRSLTNSACMFFKNLFSCFPTTHTYISYITQVTSSYLLLSKTYILYMLRTNYHFCLMFI